MYKELEEIINKAKSKTINLKKDYKIDLCEISCKHLIIINKSDIVIDGKNKSVILSIGENIENELTLFYLPNTINFIEIKNLTIVINILSAYRKKFLYCIHNNSKYLKIINCKIIINSNTSQNIIGIYNQGNYDTHMETEADYLLVERCIINIISSTNNDYKLSSIYGIYNSLANSISITNSFISVVNKGNGERQKAVGIYTNGRFGRFIGNNIKSNSSHPEGLELEQGHSYGFINEGLYSIISNNNIIAEWAGVAIGLENKGDSALINGNKILATHTVCGRVIRNTGEKIMITNNVIISTSKNARLIEHMASNSIISHNHMEVLIPPNECVSGVGIYANSKYIGCNTITENMICNIKDCGIFAELRVGIISNNQVISNFDVIKVDSNNNFELAEILSERNVRTIRGEIK